MCGCVVYTLLTLLQTYRFTCCNYIYIYTVRITPIHIVSGRARIVHYSILMPSTGEKWPVHPRLSSITIYT